MKSLIIPGEAFAHSLVTQRGRPSDQRCDRTDLSCYLSQKTQNSFAAPVTINRANSSSVKKGDTDTDTDEVITPSHKTPEHLNTKVISQHSAKGMRENTGSFFAVQNDVRSIATKKYNFIIYKTTIKCTYS